MAYSIQRHLTYNLWANTAIADVIRPLDEGIVFSECRSSFPSIAKTLIHMWDAEVVWVKRLQGESLTEWPSKNFSGGKDAILDGLVTSSANVLAYVESKPGDFPESLYTYKSLKGDTFTEKIENTLFHLVNHGTYHRGQLITMLHEAGITKLPGTDLIHYLRTVK